MCVCVYKFKVYYLLLLPLSKYIEIMTKVNLYILMQYSLWTFETKRLKKIHQILI